MEAYETRDFGDRSIPEPEVTLGSIERVTRETGWFPIVWIEELDKFNPTVPRLKNLYSLIDAVYESGGMTIATSNMDGPNASLDEAAEAA